MHYLISKIPPEIEYKLTDRQIIFKVCPFCNSNKYKVYIFNDENPRGLCFHCSKKFNLLYLLLAYGIPRDTLISDINIDNYELSLDMNDHTAKPIQSDDVEITLPDYFIPFNSDHMVGQYAMNRGFNIQLKNQVCIDPKNNGLVFLVYNNDGVLVSYQIRFIEPVNGVKNYNIKNSKIHKYIYKCIHQNSSKVICLTEGPFDAITAYNWGYNGFCLWGSNASIEQLNEIIDYTENGYKICLAFDSDDAGHKATKIVEDWLQLYDINDYFIITPECGKDLNESYMNSKKFNIYRKEGL